MMVGAAPSRDLLDHLARLDERDEPQGAAALGALDVDGEGSAALWNPVLEPEREYCATLTLYGRNDLAMPAVVSNSLCAPVVNLDHPIWTLLDGGVPTTDAAADAPTDVSLVKLDSHDKPPSLDATAEQPATVPSEPPVDPPSVGAIDAQAATSDAAVLSSDGPVIDRVPVEHKDDSGCSCRVVAGGSPSSLALFLGAALIAGLERGRRRRTRAVARAKPWPPSSESDTR